MKAGGSLQITNSDAAQAQTQGLELAHANIYSIVELLECIKRQVQQIQSYSISVTQGNINISKRVQ